MSASANRGERPMTNTKFFCTTLQCVCVGGEGVNTELSDEVSVKEHRS